MKSKNMVLLALAVGCGLVAAFLTAKLGAGSKTEMVLVLVAAKNLDQGTKLEKVEDQFVRKPFPHESVPPEFIDDIATLKGKVLQRSLRAGTHCTMSDITPRKSIDLPVDPKTGTMYKAMALKVAPETMVGGLVLPGARVDVVTVERQQSGKTVSSMILQNVLVVSVDVNIVRPEEQGFIKNAQTVTLAVKQSEGMILALAQKRGDVFLMLRSPDDDKINKNLKAVSAYGGDSDKNADSDSPDEGSAGGEKSKYLIAKDGIPPGTKIDDPEQYFTESDYAGSVPNNFIVKFDELRGKVVAKAISANVPPTKEAFEDDGVKPVVPVVPSEKVPVVVAQNTPNSKRHTITFQVGGGIPWYAHYRDGRLDGGTPTQRGSAVNGSAEIKPVAKDDKLSPDNQ